MKKINILISLFMAFLIYCSLSVWGKIGIIRDEYGITGNGISFTFTDMILLLIFPLIIFILNLAMFLKKGEAKKSIKYFAIIISIMMSAISVLSLLRINSYLNKSILQMNQMQELTLNEFMEFCEMKKTGLIYVKRDDCSKCIELDEYIDKAIGDSNTIVYFYSTSLDRDKNPDEMYEFLETVNVVSVPAFLKIVKGNVVESFSFEDRDLIASLIKTDM